MQNRMPIIVALVAGALAVLLTNMYVSQVREEAAPPQAVVVVAAADLAAGAILEAKDVAEGYRYEQSLPRLAIPWGERNLYLGQELRTPVQAGDYVLISYFGAEAGAGRLSEKVDAKQGSRAFTIPVTAESSLEGSIRSGDRIDLLLTYQKPATPPTTPGALPTAGLPEFVTVSLLESVYVLATGRFDAQEYGRYKTITLMVTPDEAKLLAWSTNLGEMSVLLRNPKDVAETDRAFLSGNARTLADLSNLPMKIEDVVRKPSP